MVAMGAGNGCHGTRYRRVVALHRVSTTGSMSSGHSKNVAAFISATIDIQVSRCLSCEVL